MDPYRLLARSQLMSQSMVGTSGMEGVGFGYFREPAAPPMLTQQVKGTGEASPGLFGLPWWVWALAGCAAVYAYSK
jgi:hypothetical protein